MFFWVFVRRLGAVLAAAVCVQATARDDVWTPAQDNVAWRSECSACHVPFPPSLLTSGDWLETMANLDQHFGVDASLAPQVQAEISAYLKQNGASDWSSARRVVVPRITTTPRFEEHHRSAIRLWLKGRVRLLSDCGSCHKEAGAGP
jgi:Dihaem cytochrome c